MSEHIDPNYRLIDGEPWMRIGALEDALVSSIADPRIRHFAVLRDGLSELLEMIRARALSVYRRGY